MLKVLRWCSALIYFVVLTLLLVRPLPEIPILPFPHADKVAHFLAFGLMAAMLARAMTEPRLHQPPLWALAMAMVVSMSYAVAMEFVQQRVGREFSVFDMLAGAAGIVIATWSWTRLRKRLLFIR